MKDTLAYTEYPKELPYDEIKNLFIRMNAGDIEAKNIIIEHNLKLVRSIAEKYKNTSYDVEDIESIGRIGLIKSVETFDVNKNTQFSTYASTLINNIIINSLKKESSHNKNIYMEQTKFTNQKGQEFKNKDKINTGENIAENYEQQENIRIIYEVLREVFQELSPRDREIITLFFQDDINQYVIGGMVGVTQAAVSSVIINFRNRVKVKLLRTGIVEQSVFNGRKQKRTRSKK